MKNNVCKSLIVGGVALSLMLSCQKEESLSNHAPVAGNFNQISEMEVKAYQDLASMSEFERQNFYQTFDILSKGKGKSMSSDPDLSEAFLALEGITNADFSVEWEDLGDLQDHILSVDLPFYETDTGLYVSTLYFLNAYNELHNMINDLVNIDSGEAVLMIDLSIGDLDEINSTVTLNGIATIAPVFNQWFTPGMSYWAALKAGPCSSPPTPAIQGQDAADFIRYYANATAPHKTRCPNGVYAAPLGRLLSRDIHTSDFKNPATWQAEVVNPSWRSNTNDCLGVDNDDWQFRYSQIDPIINHGLAAALSFNSNAEFHFTDWHSHYQGNYNPNIPQRYIGSHSHITEDYYHAGYFAYSILTCRP